MDTIIQAIEQLSFEELEKLSEIVRCRAHQKNPKTIAYNMELAARFAEQDRLGKIKQEQNDKMLVKLKKLLKPGMRLKMKGCKDGKGIREFIKFDANDNLVCWQISIYRQWKKTGMGDKGQYVTTETNTNQVTTHMPDKVSQVLVDGVVLTARQLTA